jgi:hypothetical protein
MFGSNDAKKRRHDVAYGRGMEKGRQSGALERIGDGMVNLILPDSMGADEYRSYKSGYNDYVSSNDAKRRPPQPTAPTALDASEKAWYGLCNSIDFIPDELVDYYKAALFARGNQVAFLVGLSKFIPHTCSRCGVKGVKRQFKVHFLGRLRHSECRWEGYMATGSYIGFQLQQIIHTGIRAGGSMKEDADNKGERHTWVTGLFGFLFAGVFRTAAAVVLIPLHCIAALFEREQTSADVVTRVVTLAVFVTAIVIGVYEIRASSPGISGGGASPSPQPFVVAPQQPASAASVAPNGMQPKTRDKNVVAATANLIAAIENHDLAAAAIAFDQGADPNMTCSDAYSARAACGYAATPLHLAVVPDRLVGPPEPGHFPTGTEMIRTLLEHGADPNRRAEINGLPPTTALRHVVLWSETNYGVGYPSPAIVSLMLSHGADPTLDNPVQDAMTCAKTGQYPETIKACSELIELLKPPSQ